MALCVAYGFASAQAAIFSAAEAARFHTGERHMYPRPARLHLVKLRFARLRSAKHCFLDILMTPDRLWRYPLRVPLHAAVSCGGVVAQSPLCRVSGGQGYLQHNSAAERFPSPACLPSFHAIQAGKNGPSLIRLIWFVPGRFLVRRLSELTHPPKCSIARFLMSPRIFAVVPLVCAACWTLLAGVRRGLTLRGADMPFPGPGLWPALAGTGLLLCTLALCFSRTQSVPSPFQPLHDGNMRRAARNSLSGLALACVLWLCLTPFSGWLFSSAAALFLAARAAGNSSKTAALMAVIMPALLYFCIVRGLGWPLPDSLPFRSAL